MANPNISAINDLTAGTLAWKITSSQTINTQTSMLANWQTYNQSDNDKTANFTVPNVSSYSLQANGMLVVISANNQYGIDEAPTWTASGESGQTMSTAPARSLAYFSHYYLMNPNEGSGTLTIPYYPGSGNSLGTYKYSYGFAWMFANVNASNPYRGQDSNQDYISESTSYSSDFSATGVFNKGVFTNPGDMVYASGRGENNAGSRTTQDAAAPNADGGTMTVHGNWNSSWHSRVYMATRGATTSRTDARTGRSGGASSTSTYQHKAFALQPATGTSLFTIPTTGNMVVKVNQIIAANPGAADMLIELELTGMPASGGSYGTTLEDLTGDDLLTNSTSVSSGFITRGVTVPITGVHLISKPFYMTRGMGLTAKSFASGRTSNDFKDMDIIISLEVIQS